jgi:cell division protein FtsB
LSGLFAICLLASCGDKKVFQAQLAEANARLAGLRAEQQAALRDLNAAKNNIAERMNLLLKARHPESPNITVITKGSVDEIDEITEYFNREAGLLIKEQEGLQKEVDDLKKDMAEYKAAYVDNAAK